MEPPVSTSNGEFLTFWAAWINLTAERKWNPLITELEPAFCGKGTLCRGMMGRGAA